MVEYISREAISKALEKMEIVGPLYYGIPVVEALDAIENMPAADVRPVVRGKWIDCDDKYYGWNMWACSACGEEFILEEGTPDMNEYNFCPNCGADMRGEAE